jgi:dTDP-D-glucose 4,6-dehydratase
MITTRILVTGGAGFVGSRYVRGPAHDQAVHFAAESRFPGKPVPLFSTRLLDGRPVPLYGDGLHVREWIRADGHVRGIELVRAALRPGEVRNIGGGSELSHHGLTALLPRECGADRAVVTHVADRKGHDRRPWREPLLRRAESQAA